MIGLRFLNPSTTRQKVLTAEQRAKVENCSNLERRDRWLRRAAALDDGREPFDERE
jgi:hypothetical protein